MSWEVEIRGATPIVVKGDTFAGTIALLYEAAVLAGLRVRDEAREVKKEVEVLLPLPEKRRVEPEPPKARTPVEVTPPTGRILEHVTGGRRERVAKLLRGLETAKEMSGKDLARHCGLLPVDMTVLKRGLRDCCLRAGTTLDWIILEEERGPAILHRAGPGLAEVLKELEVPEAVEIPPPVVEFKSPEERMARHERLVILLNNHDSLTWPELQGMMGLESINAVGPILTGLENLAEKSGFFANTIVVRGKGRLQAGERLLEFYRKTWPAKKGA